LAVTNRHDSGGGSPLAIGAHGPKLGTMNETRLPRLRRAKPDAELEPAGTPPHVAVAPGLLDGDHIVTREADDTDADYEARRRLLAAALRVARQG